MPSCVSISKYKAVVNANTKQRKLIQKQDKRIQLLEEQNLALRDSLADATGIILTVKIPATVTLPNIRPESGVELSRDTFQNANEKAILYYMNLARVKPQLFLKKYVLPNLRDTSSYYQKTLIETLRKMQGVEALKANFTMFQLAYCHAYESGRTGYVGHARKKTCNIKGGYNAECCAYGHAGYSDDPALNYVLQLLVDEGVPSLGHRTIILMKGLKTVGVAIQPHKTYGENVVIDFSY